MAQNYQDLEAWKRGVALVVRIYRLTATWPREEQFGLTNQIRRAASSIPANIAEGQGRNTTKEFINFLGIANGSLHEVETFLVIAAELGYCDDATFKEMMDRATEVGKPLRGLIRYLRR